LARHPDNELADPIQCPARHCSPRLGIQLRGEIAPLSASGLGSVDGINNDILPKGQLPGGKSAHDKVG
jgi:hypothetical protein